MGKIKIIDKAILRFQLKTLFTFLTIAVDECRAH